MNDAIEQLQTALEACNNERRDYRDKMDIANAEVSRLQKESAEQDHAILALQEENRRLKEELTKLQTSKPAK